MGAGIHGFLCFFFLIFKRFSLSGKIIPLPTGPPANNVKFGAELRTFSVFLSQQRPSQQRADTPTRVQQYEALRARAAQGVSRFDLIHATLPI